MEEASNILNALFWPTLVVDQPSQIHKRCRRTRNRVVTWGFAIHAALSRCNIKPPNSGIGASVRPKLL
jgi:hypothetical protein